VAELLEKQVSKWPSCRVAAAHRRQPRHVGVLAERRTARRARRRRVQSGARRASRALGARAARAAVAVGTVRGAWRGRGRVGTVQKRERGRNVASRPTIEVGSWIARSDGAATAQRGRIPAQARCPSQRTAAGRGDQQARCARLALRTQGSKNRGERLSKRAWGEGKGGDATGLPSRRDAAHRRQARHVGVLAERRIARRARRRLVQSGARRANRALGARAARAAVAVGAIGGAWRVGSET
jgi:hypothetical protein